MGNVVTVHTRDGTPVPAAPLQDSLGNTVVDQYGKAILAPVGFDINQFSD